MFNIFLLVSNQNIPAAMAIFSEAQLSVECTGIWV